MPIDDNDKIPAQSLIEAAGGVLQRTAPRGPEIAIVRRERYGAEWSLPKGKVKPGESWVQAATREVEEETGYSVSIKGFAGVSHYNVDDQPKVVMCWLMEPTTGEFNPTEEVKALEWVTPALAQRRLSHREQRQLIEDVYRTKLRLVDLGAWQRLCARLRRLFAFRRHRRLVSRIETCREELQCLQQRCADNPHCRDAAWALLEMASQAAGLGLIDKGWRHFHAAMRMETLALNPETDKALLQARVNTLRQEIGKIKRWREKAAGNLLKEADYDPPVEHVYQAMLLRDEHYNNQAYKSSLLRLHLSALMTILIILVPMLLVLVNAADGPLRIPLSVGEGEVPESKFLVGVAFFGLLGSTLSAVFKAPKSTEDSRIPELTLTLRMTMLRLITGAGAAMVVIAAVKSGIVNILDPQFIAANTGAGLYTFYTVAFAAGFSERLVLKAAELGARK